MAVERFYVEVVSDEALSLAEDIAALSEAKNFLMKAETSLDKERLNPIWAEIHALERELRFYLRHKYLNGKQVPVSEALRERLKDSLIKEIPLHVHSKEIPGRSARKDEPDHEEHRPNSERPEEHKC